MCIRDRVTTTIESVIESNTPLPLVDWQECLKLAAGKTDLAQDMLKMLLNGLVLQREKVLNSQRENNFPALLAHTHYLHGGTRYCGVPRLRAACQTLETVIKKALKTSMNADDIRELLTPKIDELVQIINDLIDWRESSTEAHVIH